MGVLEKQKSKGKWYNFIGFLKAIFVIRRYLNFWFFLNFPRVQVLYFQDIFIVERSKNVSFRHYMFYLRNSIGICLCYERE